MKTTKIIKRIGFFGDGVVSENDATFKLAYNCAKLFAENGYITVNGGGPGVMLASSLGAKEVGGKVELVVVAEKDEPGKNYEGQSKKNVVLADKLYEEKNYDNRIHKLSELADVFLIFKGGTGTIAEMGYVWSVAKFNYGKHEPVIFVGRGWKCVISKLARFLSLEDKEVNVIEFAKNPKEVLKLLKSAN